MGNPLTSYYFLVLDIETSTLFNTENEPTATWLSYGYMNLYDRDGDRIETNKFRKWEELDFIIRRISQRFVSKRIICFVHNLGYEFDYLIKNLSKPRKFLTNSSHAVISAVLQNYPQIEFRCTLRLTMKSLRTLGEELGFEKLYDDYSMILPNDEISDEKWEYCCRDCDVVAKYIGKMLLKEFGSFSKCPLTKTGRVRKIYHKHYDEYAKNNKDIIWDLMPDEDCVDAMEKAFAGGIVISNPMFTAMELYNVESYDITSSYPFAQITEEYPYTIKKINDTNIKRLNDKFFIAKIKLKNVYSKYTWGWLSISKMDYFDLGSTFFNGKLMQSKEIIRTVTNVDYELIKKTYDFDEDVEILEFYEMSKYGRLPEPYIKTIEELAINKYEWKEIVSNTEIDSPNFLYVNSEYTKAKGDFNSIYGMSVQKLVQQEYEINEQYQWIAKEKTYKKIEGKHIKRNFLFGVYITAYARKNLIEGIIKNCPHTLVYADTDSIKYIGGWEFIDTNKKMPHEYAGVPSMAKLGRFSHDGEYKSFVTYGAKKYAYTLVGKSGVYLTVAGLPKFKSDDKMEIVYKGIQYDTFNGLDLFRCGTTFKNCKLGKKYITVLNSFEVDENLDVFNFIDNDIGTTQFLRDNNIQTKGGVALFSTSYHLDMTDIDKKYILDCRRLFNLWITEMSKRTNVDLKQFCGRMYQL